MEGMAMLNLIVPTYVALLLSAQAASGLMLDLQAETTVEPPADTPAIVIETPEALPSLPAESEIVPQTLPAAPIDETELIMPQAGAEIVAESEISIVSENEWGRYILPARRGLAEARTARGRFSQINADNSVSSGSFALRRPGRMRFDYDAPSPIMIIADGATVAISDSNLETVDRVPLSATPLNILLDEQITFGADVEVLQILKRPESIAITVRDLTGEMDGRLTLIFDDEAFDLLGWIAINTEGQITQVSLENTEKNVSVSPVLFRLDDPADEEDER